MARAHAKSAVFKIDDSGGTLRDISAAVASVRGLPGAASLEEAPAFDDSGLRFVRGPESIVFTVSGAWDDAATTGAATVLHGIRASTTTVSFEYGPAGDAAGAVRYRGEAWCERFEVESTLPREARFAAAFRVDGAVTIDTFP